ncbi:WD40 repeat-like protein [Sporormia fimetaria CBS 119925]|uniref:WD40 repeat-like protein n=1 Tax=Sporormia fimetaria CBS 119925 TaxID=1340428 RepID=A0A6A6V5X6_9PLEO|nr:WD40 repeat-like protein [Sporormia fimetaria CBS 119925]
MKVTNPTGVPVYTVAGSDTARPLPEWLIRKRKRSLKQDPTFANRVELLQDFGFEEASQCVRVSADGDWVMSTGTYKPQIHTHYLPHLSLSFARHTNCLNEKFLLLSSDYTKSIHLQTERFIEFHTGGGLHYSTRIPRFGRDLLYDRHSAEALIPSVGVNADGNGEVFRLNLEVGRFMRGYEVDVGGDDMTTIGGGALQGGINAGSVNVGSIAEESHNLLAFGTSLGTVEFWDSRSRNRVGILSAPQDAFEGHSEITALQFHRSGLELATGNSNGLVHLYDLRSPVPLLKKDQGYGFPIKNLIYLNTSTSSRAQTSSPKLLSADKRIIKLWDPRDGTPWTSVEPAVDLNHVEWVPDTGMLLTANEGRDQHAFFIPQLGPAPKWCSFLDNIVEEMAEDPDDPNAFNKSSAGEVYDNFKFLTLPQLKTLNLDHLVGTTGLLRPYMHGFFVAQKLYEEARLISNPDLWIEERKKSVQEKINKERESRIRGSKKAAVKVNRKLAERILEREEKEARRQARRVLENGGDDDVVPTQPTPTRTTTEEKEVEEETTRETAKPSVLSDPRFARLFEDEDFAVDETSHEFAAINPSTKLPKGLTAVEQMEMSDHEHSSSSEDEIARPARGSQRRHNNDNDEDEHDKNLISTSSYKKRPTTQQKSKRKEEKGPEMRVSSSRNEGRGKKPAERSFGARVEKLGDRARPERKSGGKTVVGEREITFAPERKTWKKGGFEGGEGGEDKGREKGRWKDRRSASGNVFRRM